MTPETYKAEFKKLLDADGEDFAERLAELDARANSQDELDIAAEHERIAAFLNSPDETAHNAAMAEIHGGAPVSVSLADVLVQR